MKRSIAALSILFFALPAFAIDANDLKEARQRWLRGNYEEARAKFEALREDPKFRIPAVVGIARTFQSECEFDKALAFIGEASKDAKVAAHPDILATKADLLYDRGRWDEALKAAQAALQLKREHFLARWVRARILRDKGDLANADQEMRWFVRTYTQRSEDDNDIKDPDELLIVGMAGAENARWHNLSDQFSFILNDVLTDALKFDKDFWPAEAQIGWMLLEKYNKPDALTAFENVLKLNPKAADALVGKAAAALQAFELKDAEKSLDDALKLQPNRTDALRLKADLLLVGTDTNGAYKLLEKAKSINPRDVATLARMAAIHLLRKEADAFAAIVKDVESFDLKPGMFYHELASCLEDRKLYTQAETYFRKSIELRPLVPNARCSLGMLYMRLGKEKDARDLLTKAFEADPFHIRIANTLKVLRHLDKYETLKTEHFDLRFDPKNDRVLAEFLAEYLESTYAELAKLFQYEPPDRILIEVFNNHEMFSGRTIGLPDLHTIGACTGKVIAMASPNGQGVRAPFGWTRVIRHELVHIFNLAQTDFQCPHWLTEGLAVRNEGIARPKEWLKILAERIQKDDLLNLDTIMLGCVRPKNADEWTLAYCQSLLYVQFAAKTYGEPCLGKILNAYKRGLDTDAAIRAGCEVAKAEFEKGYTAFVNDIVKNIRGVQKKPREKELTYEELQKVVKESPDDLDLKARLAEQYVRRRENVDEAKKMIDEVWEKKPGHPIAALLRSRFLTDDGDSEAAIAALELGLKDSPGDERLKAAAIRLYQKTNDNAKLAPYLEEIVGYDPDDLDSRLRLAKIRTEAGKHAEAEWFARDALFIDVLNEEARKLLLDALRAQGKEAEAAKIEKRYAE